MSDEAIGEEIGRRLDQLRLEANRSQAEVARELGITVKTYRNMIKGKGSLKNLIGALRFLGKLDQIDSLIPQTPFSPIQMLKLQGQKRRRASKPRRVPEPSAEEDPEW
jgi:transcriptional regulator with XRE-family HTH domain